MLTDLGLPEEKQFINQSVSIKLNGLMQWCMIGVVDSIIRSARLECVINIMRGK